MTEQKSRTSPGSGGAAEPAESRVLSLALVAVCLGYFMVILDTTIVNVALPALRVDLGAGVAGLQWVVGFVVIERRVPAPMLPMGLFSDATFSGGNAVGLLINLGFYGELFVINLYFQQVLGYSALLAGLALLPQMGMAAVGSLLSGRFTARAGSPRPTMLIGLLIGGVGLFGLTIAGAHTPYPLLIVPLVAAGFGMSFTMPAATTAVVEGVPAERAGLASGAINASRQVGGVIGVALLGAVVSSSATFIPGLRIAVIIAGAAFLTGAALTAVTVHHQAAGGGLG